MQVRLETLRQYILNALEVLGVPDSDREAVSDVYMRATLRGVGHHDIYDFPSRLELLKNGAVNTKPQMQLTGQYGAVALYDGDNGLGEVCCSFIMQKAKELSDQYGIGLCTITNSNHFLAAAPYVERAAEEGYAAVILTRGKPSMGPPQSLDKVISACPMGYAFPSMREYPVMMDMCLAYASFGMLQQKAAQGLIVPEYWGVDKNGEPTSSPEKMLDGGTRSAIGGHKGLGLSLLAESFLDALAGGGTAGRDDRTSQLAFVLRPGTVMDASTFRQRASDMLDAVESRSKDFRAPGSNSYEKKKQILKAQTIEIQEELTNALTAWAESLNISCDL